MLGEVEYTKGKSLLSGTFTKFYNHIELKALIQSTLGVEAIKLTKDKFVIHRDGRKFTPLHYDEVIAKSKAIAFQGWVAPVGTKIKGYCTDFKPRPGFDERSNPRFPGRIRYYRLIAKDKCLPGKKGQLVRVVHIKGGIGSEDMEQAISRRLDAPRIAALKRRNEILKMKFHCIEQKFLEEFLGTINFDFLGSKIHIYP